MRTLEIKQRVREHTDGKELTDARRVYLAIAFIFLPGAKYIRLSCLRLFTS